MKFALSLLFVLPLSATALEKDLSNALQTGAGIYSSIYIHELGHALVLKSLGATNIQIQVPRPDSIFSGSTSGEKSEPFTQEQLQWVAASGLIAANVAAEVVMQRKGLHQSPYAQSILGTSLVSNLLHVRSYYTKYVGVDGYRGNDIDAYAMAGGNPHVMSALLTGYTLWTLHRMKKQNIPLFYINMKF